MAQATETLTPIKTVLCAIDFSPGTPQVLAQAAELAETYDASLTVLHVVEVWDARYDFMVADLMKRIEHEANEKLQAELTHLGKTRTVPVEVVIEKGRAAQRILEVIKQRRPDLVVMGSHGTRGMDRILLGSVTDKVLRVSPVSVLSVRPAKRPDIAQIVCAVDFSAPSRNALLRAIELARLVKRPSVKVINVFEVPVGFMEAGMTYQSAAQKIEAVHRNEMAEFLRTVETQGISCEPIVREGPEAPTIAALAEELAADLLIVGSHGRSSLAAFILGSTSSRIFHQTKVSTLIIKAPAQRESLWQALDSL